MNGIESYRELKPNIEIQKLVTSFSDALPAFPNSEEFSNVLKKKKNENQHTTALCLYMINFCNSTFIFMPQNAQKGSSTIDIGVYKGKNLIFVIEAKILPTPKGSNNQPRHEHEYVYGKGAGIQRFISGAHGVDNEDLPFSDSGMLAYVKENDFVFWQNKVNQWILDFNRDSSEQLQKVSLDKTATFISAHARQDGSLLRLHHFWVYVI